MLVAAAAMAFFACQKPEVIEPETSHEVMLTFSSEKPEFNDETKTEWTAETIQWSKGDKISVAYTVAANWQSNKGDAEGNAKIYQSNPINEAASVANFSVPTSFTGETVGTHVFYAVYPALGYNDLPNAPVANISISPNQNPKAESFDSSADVMVGVSGEYATRPVSGETISLKWNRLVAHAVLTLKGINGFTEGEVIESITLTAQDGANLVGMQNVNLITREVAKNEQNTSSNVLKISANNLTVNNGTVTFWACVLPETLTALTVEVKTDKATYTREITGISKTFKQNARNLLSIMMNEAVREENAVASDEVVDVLTRSITGATSTTYVDWSGKTLTSSAVYAGNSAGGNNSIQLRSDKSSAGIVTTTSGGFAKKVVVTWNSNTSSGRTLSVYGKTSAYDAATDLYSSNNRGDLLGTIVCGTSTELIIDGDYEYIGLRSNSGAMYVEEIKITWSTTPSTDPKLTLAETALELPADATEGEVAVTAKNISDIRVTAIVEEGSQDESGWLVAEYDEANSCVKYSASANESEESRTAYIEVYCLDADGKEVVAGVNVTQKGVTAEPAGPQVVTVAEFLAAAVGDKEYQLTGVMSGTYNTTYGNFYLEDETGKVLVYGLTKTKVSENDKSFASIGLRDGDTLTLIGTRADYNGTAQVGGPAYYISHVAAPYIDLDNAVATVDAEATTYAIAVTSNCAWTAVASTGVTLDKSSATGNATVNMTFAANETEDAVTHTLTFTSGSLTQTFTLTQNGVVTGDTVEPVKATLSFADKAQRTTFTSTQQIWEQNGIKVTNNKASSSNAVADYAKPARFYAGSNLEVTAPGAISMIVFDANSSSYATAMKNSIGTVSGANVAVNSDKVTITFSTPVASFTVAKFTAQVRMDSMDVTYIPEN